MLEFMKRRSIKVNYYSLMDRFGDCEPSLVCFNYITPMAVCVETITKILWLEFSPNDYPLDIEKKYLPELLNNKAFKAWLKNQYDISEGLLGDVDKLIRKESNKFKHSLSTLPKRSIEEKKKSFHCFYTFVSKYYKAKTGEDAPSWKDADFYDLMNSEINGTIRRMNQIYRNGGTGK